MNDIERQDRIDRYVRGEMTDGEGKAFEAEMESDARLAEEVELNRSISRHICTLAEKKRLMAEWENVCPAMNKNHSHKVRWVSAIAGMAACIAVGLFYWQSRLNIPLGGDPLEDGRLVPMRGGLQTDEIECLVDSANYEEALDAIEVAMKDTLINLTLPDEEREYQMELQREMQYQLAWLKIRSLVGLDRTAEAVGLLKVFVERKGEYQQEAESWLKNLEEK